MARGTIDSGKKKIHVTGFTRNNQSEEEIYKVAVVGASTADTNNGTLITSNIATVKHQIHAVIQASNAIINGNCGTVNIQTTNIKPDSVVLTQYPTFVSEYSIIKVNDNAYVLEFCVYANYRSSETGAFVFGGYDKYGNLITSNEVYATSHGGAVMGNIDLYCPSTHASTIAVGASVTSFTLAYNATPYGTFSNIVVNSVTDNVTSVSIDGDGNSGTVTLRFMENGSSNFSNTYKIAIKGTNQYGDEVPSNEVTITQGKRETGSDFYTVGNDIEYNETQATFIIYHPSTMTGINVYSYSSTITGVPLIYPGATSTEVVVNTDVNDGNGRKALTIHSSGKTSSNKVLYSDCTIYQKPSIYLYIYNAGKTNPSTSVTGPDVDSYTQSTTFEYTSSGVNGISVSGDTAFIDAGGNASLNTTTKKVKLVFGKNTDTQPRTFTVRLSGTDGMGRVKYATYTFTQLQTNYSEFMLTSGGSQSGRVESNTEIFTLDITRPGDYSGIGVSKNQSNSANYKIYRTELTNNGTKLKCYIYKNTTSFELQYTIQLSGLTADSKVKYTNDFRVTHKTSSNDGNLQFTSEPPTEPLENNVSSYPSGSGYINFSYANMEFISVMPTASDGVNVNVVGLVWSGGTGKFRITFTANPTTTRTIRIRLTGSDERGNYVEAPTEFVLQQKAPEEGKQTGIYIYRENGTLMNSTIKNYPRIPQGQYVPAEGGEIRYRVEYVNVEPDGINYNRSFYRNVTITSTYVYVTNNDTSTVQLSPIVFKGISKVDGKRLGLGHSIYQYGVGYQPRLSLSFDQNRYNQSLDCYMVSTDGEVKDLLIDYQDVDYDTVEFSVSPEENATVNKSALTIDFRQADNGGGTDRHNNVGRIIDEETVEVPVGNDAVHYIPKAETITKYGGEDMGDRYDFHVYLDPDTGETTECWTSVWANGTGYAREEEEPVEVVSNVLRFLQSGTTDTNMSGGGGGADGEGGYKLEVTVDAHNSSYYNGNYGLYAYDSTTPNSSTNIDTDMKPNKWGLIKKTYRGRVLTSNLSVSTTDNGTSEFWINPTKSSAVCEIHRGIFGTLNIYGYAFRNSVVNNEREVVYVKVTGETVNGEIVSKTVANIPANVAYIEWGYDYYEPIPDNGGTSTLGLNIKNIDVASLTFSAISPEFSSFYFDQTDLKNWVDLYYGGRYQKVHLQVTLTQNRTPQQGYDYHVKYFKASGRSTLDGSTIEETFSIWQGIIG